MKHLSYNSVHSQKPGSYSELIEFLTAPQIAKIHTRLIEAREADTADGGACNQIGLSNLSFSSLRYAFVTDESQAAREIFHKTARL
ncbi:MAG: hypothetical protein CXZ00_15750 [Acidobacteria bacterium]|nr:MAG: hypothetical protein CXZ00_15750 [Acidobacteriota bacterium]